MSEKTLMIVNAKLNPNEKDAFTYYSEKSGPLFKEAGAKPIAKHKITKTIIGSQDLHVIAIMEFPSEKAITNVFSSEAYKELLPHRDKAFAELSVFVSN